MLTNGDQRCTAVADLGHHLNAAAVSLQSWSFDVLGLHRIEINHPTQNRASCVLSYRMGYLAEGQAQRGITCRRLARPESMQRHEDASDLE